jgi:dihydrofolate synthase/folylpolyglutamate synthase
MDNACLPEDPRALWSSLINYEQRAPVADDLKLDRMRSLLAQIGDPHRRLRIVHVAGSKGKGSTAAMLASVLSASGYRTGLFTSPHLCGVEERFQIDGRPIPSSELNDLLSEVGACVQNSMQAGLSVPTFFEVATAVGFVYFLRRGVEAAVLEVGLGGRLDSTNVCDAEVAVITSISFDHTKLLGSRLTSIAREKAGIIKAGRPVVSGVVVPEARAVIEQTSKKREARLQQLGADFHYRYQPGFAGSNAVRKPRVEVTTWKRRWSEMELNLLGEHQAANASVAIACVEQLRTQGWHLPDDAVAKGLSEVIWPARMEVVSRRPLVVLDCAHNVASAAALVETLQSSFPPGRRLLLFAGSSDKDIPGMFRVLAPQFDHAFLTRYTDNPRSVAQEQLLAWWRAAGDRPATPCATPREAWTKARQMAAKPDLICITGSVFLAGEMRPLLLRDSC